MITSRRGVVSAAAAATIAQLQQRARIVVDTLDVEDAAQAAAVAQGLDGLDVLVNNAGASLPGGRSEWEPDVFERSVRINLVGAFRVASACRPLLAAATPTATSGA